MKINFTLCLIPLIILCVLVVPISGQQPSSNYINIEGITKSRLKKFPFTTKQLLPGSNDCDGAEVICDDGPVSFTPSGPGADDFASAANDNGCLNSDENQSAWYYFEMNDDTPPSSTLEFTISPFGGFGEDYDFAVYGPDVPCDNLGSPIRCSYAGEFCFYCPQTGLGNGSNQTSEGQFGDGFVAPLTVSAGQGFYLVVDNYAGSSNGFDLDWGGSGADYLNCIPNCDLEVSADTDGSYCAGDVVNITAAVSGDNGNSTGQWTAVPSIAITYLGSSNNPNTTVTIPSDATGSITYTYNVTEEDCEATDDVTIIVLPPPITNPATLESCADENGNGIYDLTSLNSTVGNDAVVWYTNSTGTPPAITNTADYISMGGIVYAVVSSADGCESIPQEVTLTVDVPDCDDGCQYTEDTVDADCNCVNTLMPPVCNDNDCNTVDAYNSAICDCEFTPIPPPDCDDNDCNTLDTYNTTTCLCENTLIPPPNCDDNDCTTDDSYDATTCNCINTPIPPPSCDDNDCNTLDTYNTTTCLCENTLIPPPDCDDNDCTTDDSYDATTCNCINTPIPPPSCDDNDCNTLDTYNTTTCLCENTPIPPPDCDDNDCTTDDSYDATTCNCINTPISPPDCDDNDCNTLDTYNTNTCLCENTPIPPPNCDDNDCNTLDIYNTTNCMCENTLIPPPDCDDNCILTIDTYNTATCVCENTPPDPDDGCPLTIDSYDAVNCEIINTQPDPDDDCALTTDSYDAANCVIINTPPNPADACPLTTDIWDGVNCQIINTPPDCNDGCSLTMDSWDEANCQCINTPPNPDDGCALTDDVYDSANCVIINTPPNPDDGCALTADSWNPDNCTVVNIPPSCNDGCQYTTDTFNETTCMCENVLVVPSCDDNECATADSYDEPNCQCINTPILPPEVMNTSIDLCEEDNLMATFDLTSVEEFVSNNSGTPIEWVNAMGNPIGNSANYFTGTTTVSAFVYDNQSPPCQSTAATINLTVTSAPNSGEPLPPSTYCNNQSSPINLSLLLNNEQGGGTWEETSLTPTSGNSFNPNAGTVTPNGIDPGTYTFSYTIPAVGLCPSQTSEVTILVEVNPVVLLGTFSLTTCNTPAEGTILNLQETIVFGDMTGTWNDLQGAGVDLSDPNNVDFDGVTPGLYLFGYTTAAAVFPCQNDTYTLNIFVEDCGCPSVATAPTQGICNDNGVVDLSSLEITEEEGSWTISTTPAGGNPATLTGDNFDASSADAGDYEVTFTLENFPGTACPESSSQVITVSAVPQPNHPSDQEECDAYILPVITGTNLSGNETYFTDTNGTGAMYMAGDAIDFTTPIYILDDNSSCSGEVSFNIIINDTPELITPNDQNICDEYILPIITGTNLSGNEGYYSQTGGIGTSYDAGDAITTSSEIFIYDTNGSCSDEVSFIINVELTPIIDNPGAQTSCGNFELPEITGTNLTGTVGYYSEPNGMGINYSVGSEIATNSNIYVYAANGTCEDEVVFSIVLTNAPNAGTAEPAQIICNDQTSAIFLETLLTGEDPGGIWTEISATSSTNGAFNPASGTFNPNNQAAGNYEFAYTLGGGNCPPAESVVTVSISTPPTAEFNAFVTNTCNVSASGSIVNLTALLIGGDTGGIWTDNAGAVVTDPTSIDFDGQIEGSYNYQYTTNSALAPCNDQSYDIEILVGDCSCPSIATIPPNDDLCQDDGILDLTTLLLTSEPGNWIITTTPTGGNSAVLQGNNFNASGADAGEYEITFTLAIPPPAGCPTSSSQMITVSTLPQIDNSGTLVGCEEVLLPAITGIDLETAVYFAEAGGSGASYNVGDAITTNTTLFVLATNGSCTNEISFDININQPPNPGTPTPAAVACNDDNTSISLADLLIDETIGGTWTEISGTTSTGTAFNAAAGTFNPETQTAGTYSFTYIILGEAPCNEASATVSVIVEAAPFATFSATTVNVCNVAAQGSTVDLTSLFSSGDTSGTWTDNTGAVVNTPENLDFDGTTPNNLTYTYTTGNTVSPCENVSYEVDIVIEDCACPSVATSAPADLCNDAGLLDLTVLQITSEEGTWTITNMPSGTNSATITGTIFDAINADAGVYELTFTLNTTPSPDCPTSSTQNITVSDLPDAGTGSTTESCDTNESLIDLTDFLSGSDAGGIWSVNPTSDTPNTSAFDATNATFNPFEHPTGVYVFDYTINGIAPCPNTSTSVTITINPCECPSLELGIADPLCNDSGMINLSTLQITDEAGTWTITNSPTGINSAIISGTFFDATSADAGVYELTFTITATPPDGCPTTNSLEITVNAPPNAGSGGTVSQCNEDGIIDLAALLTGSDADGIWSLNTSSDTPITGAFDNANGNFDPIDNINGTYIFDYTVDGIAPCNLDVTSVTVTIVSCDCPSVELANTSPICNNETVGLSTLQITTELGTWSIANAPTGSSANISGTTFDANGTIAGTYTLQFILTDTPPTGCPNSNSIALEISSSGNAGTADADYILCNSLSENIDLFEELSNADTGGTWSETSTNVSTGNAFNAASGIFDMTEQADGIYTFLYTIGNATDICPIDTETVTVQITETPIANAGVDMMIDCNITMVTLTGTSSSGADVDFSWINENGQEIGTNGAITVDEPGDFILTTSEGGCMTSDSVTVTADQTAPDIDAGDDVTLDCDESNFVIEAIGDTGDEFTYDWTTDNGEIENPDLFNPNVTGAGTYNIVVTNFINGCTSTDQIVISYLNGITGVDMLSQEPPCYQDESGYIFVTNVQGGEQPINFNLNNEDLGETQAFTSLGAGSYELTLTDANGCTWDTLIVFAEYKELELDLGESQFIEFGEAAVVEGNTNASVIDTVIWEGPDSLVIECLTSDCLEMTASPTETVTLQATIIDINGCETTAFITIFVRKEDNIFVPNVFSPDNDGENEFFYIFADENVLKINEFLVFDRWGETVHEYYQFFPNDPDFGWDGNHRGEPMDPQVLVWYAEVEFVDGRVKVMKGNVTLLR